MTKDEIQKNSEHWYNKYKDAEKRIAELEEKLANADYQLEGRDLEIKELKAQIAEQYALILNPTEKLTSELRELGVI